MVAVIPQPPTPVRPNWDNLGGKLGRLHSHKKVTDNNWIAGGVRCYIERFDKRMQASLADLTDRLVALESKVRVLADSLQWMQRLDDVWTDQFASELSRLDGILASRFSAIESTLGNYAGHLRQHEAVAGEWIARIDKLDGIVRSSLSELRETSNLCARQQEDVLDRLGSRTDHITQLLSQNSLEINQRLDAHDKDLAGFRSLEHKLESQLFPVLHRLRDEANEAHKPNPRDKEKSKSIQKPMLNVRMFRADREHTQIDSAVKASLAGQKIGLKARELPEYIWRTCGYSFDGYCPVCDRKCMDETFVMNHFCFSHSMNS